MIITGLIIFLIGAAGILVLSGAIPAVKSLPLTEAEGFVLIFIFGAALIVGAVLMAVGAISYG